MTDRSPHTPQSSFDVVVIGSGLGGLTAANILAKQNQKVLLLESHHQLGGLATWFRRKGHIFDVSLHGFPYGMVKSCRKYWNEEITNTIIPIREIRFNNPEFQLKTQYTKEDFFHILETQFQVASDRIAAFFTEILNLSLEANKSQETLGELFARHFPHRPDVIRLLLEPITYANGHTLNDPALSYAIVFSNFMRKGVYTVRGGTDHLINLMEKELRKNGVEILKRTAAQSIRIKNGRVHSVLTNRDQEFCCRSVVSNANLAKTIEELVGHEQFRSPSFLQQAGQMRMNSSSSQVYIGLKEGASLDFAGDLIFHSTHPSYDLEKILSKEITSRTFSIYYPEHIRPHHNRYTIVSSSNSRYEDWVHLSPQAYAAEKRALEIDTIACLKTLLPDIEEKIDSVEAATPLTIERYTGHRQGSSFGTKFEGLHVSRQLPEQIGGLYHAGSVGIIMSGWLGAANYGAIVANDVASYLHTQTGEKNERI